MKQHFILILLITSLAGMGCANKSTNETGDVIIDRKGVDMGQYRSDLEDCRSYSEEVPMGRNVSKGAAGGALVGGLIGVVVDEHRSVARGAGIGAVSGGARGVIMTEQERQQVLKNCLIGRGYRVLN